MLPLNDLDRAITALRRSRAALPDFCRELVKGELWFLVPYHPEIEGEWMEIKNGSPLPFAVLKDDKGEIVPLFSSDARLDEGLANGKLPENRFSAAAMPAIQALEIIGKADLRAVINKSCATGELTIPANLMRDLADGTALKPSGAGDREHGEGKILNPADYPTYLIQPAFEFMRRHHNFRAAWIITLPDATPDNPDGTKWQVLILMDPQDEKIVHDLNLVLQSARSPSDTVGLGLLEETNADEIQNIFRRAAPFYLAADFKPPAGAKPQV